MWWGRVSMVKERCLVWNRRSRAICPPTLHCLWRLRPCPPSRCSHLQCWWARGTQQRVRLVCVCTPRRCCKGTRLTCSKSRRRISESFHRFHPHRSLAQGAAGREQPLPHASTSYRESQKESDAAHAPPWRGQDGKKGSRSRASKPKADLRTILQAKRSSAKKLWCLWPRVAGVPPAGEEQRSPQCTVPVSPQCPQEIGLLTIPCMVFQGAAISCEHTSQFLPPGNVAELKYSPALRGSLKQLVWPSLPVCHSRAPN